MGYKYIVIEGNIGAGKTSLVTRMAEDLKAKLILERFEDNPFLPRFYENPDRYSLTLELSFLIDRYHHLKQELCDRDIFSLIIISDYYFSKSLIFAKITLKEDEFNLFSQLYNIMHQYLPIPDLYVYLFQPVNKLRSNILKRGREYEKKISLEYLEQIQKGYFEYFKEQTNMKIVIIDLSSIDYVGIYDDYLKILNCILKKKFSQGINRIIL